MLKKIAIVGSVGLPASYGGWETLVDHLTICLRGQYDFTVFCSAKKYDRQLETYNGATLRYVNFDANGVQSIPYDLISMLRALRFADVVLVLGVSGCIFLPLIKLFSRKKFIVNIDGMEWRRAKWGRFAKWFLKLSEAAAVRSADVVVSDNLAIQQYVSRQYGRDAALIAYGADHGHAQSGANVTIADAWAFAGKPYAFKVCRIEPENNIDIILECFAGYDGMDLVIIGNWNNSAYGAALKQKYAGLKHIHLLDPIYDPQRLNAVRGACQVYVHGHSAGGTNPSLVEAMYLGLPVMAYGCDFNRHTTHDAALYFNDAEQLRKLLSQTSFTALQEVGASMKRIADDVYTWKKISAQYASLF